jgi:hypothetical protein
MRYQIIRSICAVSLTFLLLSPSSRAAETEAAKEMKMKLQTVTGELAAACKEDLKTYCNSVTTGEARIAFCMLAHEDKISTKCSDALAGVADKIDAKMSKMVRLSLACEGDLNKNCDAVRAGKGRLVQCIRDHKGTLSEACKAELGE